MPQYYLFNNDTYSQVDRIYDYLVECQIATATEIRLDTSINGYNVESLNDILYSRTGYKCISQLQEAE